jgi:hypothetical protein
VSKNAGSDERPCNQLIVVTSLTVETPDTCGSHPPVTVESKVLQESAQVRRAAHQATHEIFVEVDTRSRSLMARTPGINAKTKVRKLRRAGVGARGIGSSR